MPMVEKKKQEKGEDTYAKCSRTLQGKNTWSPARWPKVSAPTSSRPVQTLWAVPFSVTQG